MRARFLFVLGGTLFLLAGGALAGPKEDVAAATAKWGETLAQNDPDKVLALYRQQCERIERRSVTISLARSRSCPLLRCRSASS
jgi:hypothetical protein